MAPFLLCTPVSWTTRTVRVVFDGALEERCTHDVVWCLFVCVCSFLSFPHPHLGSTLPLDFFSNYVFCCCCFLSSRQMSRNVRWPINGCRGRWSFGCLKLLGCFIILSWMLWCLFSFLFVGDGENMEPPLTPSTAFTAARENNFSGRRPWGTPRGSTSIGVPSTANGPKTVSACQSSVCRFCDEMRPNNVTSFLHPWVVDYIRRHVLIGVITGSFEKFFRVDLALCTWLGHVPASNLFIYTDAANTSDGRHGTWIETDNALASKQLPREMLRRTGYSVGWMRAQYRFFHAFNHFAGLTGVIHNDSESIGDYRDVRWAVVMDDDSFIDLHALVRFLHRRDLYNVAHTVSVATGTKPLLLQERCKQCAGAQAEEVAACLSLPERWNHLQEQQRLHGDEMFGHRSKALVVGSVLWNVTTETLFNPTIVAALGPLYIGDHGWGGAGHFMNLAGLRKYAQDSEGKCVQQHLIGKRLASDTALHRCLPLLGIHRSSDAVLSHCQARFLQHRLLSGDLVSMHAKRDVVQPKYLAMWRIRLYYQVLYHHNRTAYDLLMRVGACAYGYTCKVKNCGAREDAKAVSEFLRLSDNDTHMPLF
ncbi:hypothetical protein MOQ_007866 [Trypanosoma cruzi marinkellei]|uniref:Uncharacterized protein n=1 Tax=Trypanosoma cruzi marinkellei TaxID=85056 RepID=K2NHF0_TRYCR|nr:hypothetical protein MOQ_007866 [Trypanosoma cruzi marinkellei]